jgi:hypothetical protein
MLLLKSLLAFFGPHSNLSCYLHLYSTSHGPTAIGRDTVAVLNIELWCIFIACFHYL